MYWNNPLHELTWPSQHDPIVESFHSGSHCLFYNHYMPFDRVQTNQRLGDLANWAQDWLMQDGIEKFVADPRNHYDIANLVKLNMWIHDIRKQGIVKPWLMLDQGDGTFLAGTGDSRLRCLERIPEITRVPAFITTRTERAHLYQSLEQIYTFDRFAELCKAVPGQQFLFRLTDTDAPYGIYWYEYNSDRTRSITPGESEAVAMFENYYSNNTGIIITPEWFDSDITWEHYRSNS